MHDAFAEVKIDDKMNLPQIAVVGGQSSGKSSVLENIVGRDFLPRGSGIVTPCPLVLQLVQTFRTQDEWAEFLHLPGRKFTNFNEVRLEIENRTREIAGDKCVSDLPINLRIYSPKVLTLTLVDLPGLVTTAIQGQPADIDKQIRTMVRRYVSQSNTIILAISAATQDIATSAGLQLAREVDPQGLRTLGVLTKLDVMEEGTDALQTLKGHVVALKRGFIGVVNRSQKDINENKNISEARKAEIAYFRTHPIYSEIADQCGTDFLTKTLSKLLLEHIHASLPELSLRVDAILAQTRKQMEKLGMFEIQTLDKSNQLLIILRQFSDAVNKALEGAAVDALKLELGGGARIEWIFNEHFGKYVGSLDATEQLPDDLIRTTIMNMNGMNAALFPSDRVFIELAKLQVVRLEAPALKCVTFIHDELFNIVRESAGVADRFPELRRRIVDCSQQLLHRLQAPTHEHIRVMIKAERAHINVRHPGMLERSKEVMRNMFGAQYGQAANGTQQQQAPGGAPGQALAITQAPANGSVAQQQGGLVAGVANAVAQAAQAWDRNAQRAPIGAVPVKIMPSGDLTEHERATCKAIRDLVCSYFKIVKQTVVDQTPKVVALLLIDKLREDLYPKLVAELYKPDSADQLLAEPDDVVKTRAALTSMHKCLVKAQDALNRVKDLRLH